MKSGKTTIFILILTTLFSFFSCAGGAYIIEDSVPGPEQTRRPQTSPKPVKTELPAQSTPVPTSTPEEDPAVLLEKNNNLSLESLMVLDTALRGMEEEVTHTSSHTAPMRDPVPFIEEVPKEIQLDLTMEEGFSVPGWETSSPEEQGIDSALLADMYEFIMEKGYNYDSILLARNGVVVSETTFYPHQPYHRHMLGGLTRGVTALLTGIAIELEYIKGVDQSIWDFFPEIDRNKLSANKKKITIHHLLTMSAGFAGGDFPSSPQSFKPIFFWMNLGGTFQEILDRPVNSEPGSRLTFDSFNLQILSEIISRATGSSTEEFAYEYLFKPLEIEHYFWSAQGAANYGGWYLNMSHRDIAKIAQLHLNKGIWNERQIIPEKWIEETFTPVIGFYDNEEIFGYQWFAVSDGIYTLPGMLGQEIGIMVDEKYLLVITGFTSGILDQATSLILIDKYILPALKSDNPLDTDEEALERLRNVEKIASRYTGGGVSALDLAGHRGKELQISGKNYFLNKNDFGWNKISLEFAPESDEMILNIDNWRTPVGMDGKYRSSMIPLFHENQPFEVFCKGNWTEKDDFFIEVVYETGVVFTLNFTFSDDSVKIVRKNSYYYRNPIYVLKGLKE